MVEQHAKDQGQAGGLYGQNEQTLSLMDGRTSKITN